jgi:hypothetical protein
VVATKPVDFRRGGESLASLAREDGSVLGHGLEAVPGP